MFCFASLVLMVQWAHGTEHDASPSPYNDLMPTLGELPPREENGYYRLAAGLAGVWEPDTEREKDRWWMIATGQLWDEQLVEKVLSHNTAVLRALEEALTLPSFRVPVPGNLDDVSSWLPLAGLVSARAGRSLKSGEVVDAAQGAVLLVAFGSAVQSCGGTLLHYDFGAQLKGRGALLLQRIAPKLQSERKLFFARELQKYPFRLKALRESLKVDFSEFVKAAREVKEGKRTLQGLVDMPIQASAFKPGAFEADQTIEMVAGGVRQLLAAIGKPAERWNHYDYLRGKDIPLDLAEASRRQGVLPNVFGRWLVDHWLLAWGISCELSRESRFYVSAVPLAIWLEDYHSRHGRPAEDLDALVPEYTERIPLDPFDGKPIRYSRKRLAVYSVGSNREDEGGSKDRSSSPEPTLYVEPPRRAPSESPGAVPR